VWGKSRGLGLIRGTLSLIGVRVRKVMVIVGTIGGVDYLTQSGRTCQGEFRVASEGQDAAFRGKNSLRKSFDVETNGNPNII